MSGRPGLSSKTLSIKSLNLFFLGGKTQKEDLSLLCHTHYYLIWNEGLLFWGSLFETGLMCSSCDSFFSSFFIAVRHCKTITVLAWQVTNALHCLTSIFPPSQTHDTHTSIWKYNGLQWQLTCIQIHSLAQTCIQAELSHTWAFRTLSPAREEVSWILQLFLYTATQELIGYLQGKPIVTPLSDTRSRIKKRRHYIHTHTQS